MYHIHRATEADFDAWALVPADDATETEAHAATDAELLDRGVRVLDRSNGEVLFDCAWLAHFHDRQPCPKPGEIIGTGRLGDRFGRQPPPVRRRVMRGRVFRNADGSSLRAELAAELGIPLPPRARVPPEVLERVLEKRRQHAETDPEAPPAILEATVKLDEVESSDVLVDDEVPGNRWAGEPPV